MIAKRKHAHVTAHQRSVDSLFARDPEKNLGKIETRRPPALAKLARMAAAAARKIEHPTDARRRDDSLYERDDPLGFGGIAVRIERDVFLAEPALKPF